LPRTRAESAYRRLWFNHTGIRRYPLSKKELTERDDAIIRRRIAERQVLKDAIWFANQPTFDLRAVCERLGVLPPFTRGGVVQIRARWRVVQATGKPTARSVNYSQRLHGWWVQFLANHVNAVAARHPITTKGALVALGIDGSRIGDLQRLGSDVFARVGFTGQHWEIASDQPFVTPTLVGFVRYASSLVLNPKLEWSR